jgi:hypothetical protein
LVRIAQLSAQRALIHALGGVLAYSRCIGAEHRAIAKLRIRSRVMYSLTNIRNIKGTACAIETKVVRSPCCLRTPVSDPEFSVREVSPVEPKMSIVGNTCTSHLRERNLALSFQGCGFYVASVPDARGHEGHSNVVGNYSAPRLSVKCDTTGSSVYAFAGCRGRERESLLPALTGLLGPHLERAA